MHGGPSWAWSIATVLLVHWWPSPSTPCGEISKRRPQSTPCSMRGGGPRRGPSGHLRFRARSILLAGLPLATFLYPSALRRWYPTPSPRPRRNASLVPLAAFSHPSALRRATWYRSTAPKRVFGLVPTEAFLEPLSSHWGQ